MQKIKIRLPATMTLFGPIVGDVGLAIGLYTNVSVSPRDDNQLIVETDGIGAGEFALGLKHPVVLGMMRVFQRLERAPRGITIRIQNEIPTESGLGATTTFMLAGIVAANNLLGYPFNRDDLIDIGIEATGQPAQIISAMTGGLNVSEIKSEQTVYTNLPITPFKLIIAIPELDDFSSMTLPDMIEASIVKNIQSRLPLFLEGLARGDLDWIAETIDNDVLDPLMKQAITGYAHVRQVASLAGVVAVTTSGGGPAMIFLAHRKHDRIAEVIESAFRNLDIDSNVLIVPIDTQGIVISMMQSGS